MNLTAYAQAVERDIIQIWVGIFGTENPPTPIFFIDNLQTAPIESPAMTAIRDGRTGTNGLPVNHRGIFRFASIGAGRNITIDVLAGSERYVFSSNTLPQSVPPSLEGSFNILLCSCYFQPEDEYGRLGAIVSQIKLQPHLTVMAGDQVYLDLPLFEDLPETEPYLSQALGDKYRRNWASTQLRIPGLETVLTRAPVVNVPDDHEFWNNYPFRQKQLPNTWDANVRQRWANAAQALYEDYQLSANPVDAGATRLDVTPLKMLFLDMRCRRDTAFQHLMNVTAEDALLCWANDLISDRRAGKPAVGLLGSGQALFVDAPVDQCKKVDVDAEMANFSQFQIVSEQLARLADAGVPIVYLTGDVHWGRVTSGVDTKTGRTALYEVISSPSRLIRVPFLDTAKEAANTVKGVFGDKDPWPRHSDPEKVPKRFGEDRRFALHKEFGCRGDHVAIVSFASAGTGLEFQVTYYNIHWDKTISKSKPTEIFKLTAF